MIRFVTPILLLVLSVPGTEVVRVLDYPFLRVLELSVNEIVPYM